MRNHIQGDLGFLNATDGSFSDHRSITRNRLDAAKSKSTLSHGRWKERNGRGLPIVGFVGCDLGENAKVLQRYQPSPLVRLGDQSWLVEHHPC